MRLMPALLVLGILQCCILPGIRCAIEIDKAEDLELLTYTMSKYSELKSKILMAELPDSIEGDVEERVLKGLAYIPLQEQKYHRDYWEQGFPGLKDLATDRILDGQKIYSAVPRLDVVSGAYYIYIQVDQNDLRNPNDSFAKALIQKCHHKTVQPLLRLDISLPPNMEIYACEIRRSDLAAFHSPLTLVLDMFGQLALNLHGNSHDVYMKALGPKGTIPPTAPTFNINYQFEEHYGRLMWPAWVNMYLFLRHSYHSCVAISVANRVSVVNCSNLFFKINQLSLTYAYFVCRILSGNVQDSICPSVCQLNPCARISNAISGTCQTIGFRIHRFDYFCFCQKGYFWETEEGFDTEGRYTNGKCTAMKSGTVTQLVEECTILERMTFCNDPGTESCSIDRISDNRRPACKCYNGYTGLDCSYTPKDSCHTDQFKGYLRCREHQEKVGVCKVNPTNSSKYYCECTSKEHIRAHNGSSDEEECQQWIPSVWHDRAVSCGYQERLVKGRKLGTYCNTHACSPDVIRRYLAQEIEEKGFACNGLGTCTPMLKDLTTKSTSQCNCNHGYTGTFCNTKVDLYPIWTPWTICYEKGIVRRSERARLRYRKCRFLFHNGSSPSRCIGGESQTRGCPDMVDDLPDTLTPTDYGVASQAVISMWRVVELMMIFNFLLLLLLAGILLYQKTVLGRLNL